MKPRAMGADRTEGQLKQGMKRKKGRQARKKEGTKSYAKKKARGWVITVGPGSLKLRHFIMAVDAVAMAIGEASGAVCEHIEKAFSLFPL